MLDDIYIRSIVAGLGIVLAAGPLGCFVIWRRMAYFGDATAHAAVLGVALSLAFKLPIFWGVLILAFGMATAIVTLVGRSFSADTILGVTSHSALAFGLVAVSFIPSVQVDLMSYLFGDILAVSPDDVGLIWRGSAIVFAVLLLRWTPLLTATINEELAHSIGLSPRREQIIITFGLALVVAVSIKVVGALLIGAMLVIPAAAARPLVKTPEAMAAMAMVIGTLAVIGGVTVSFANDTPTGPTIVSVAAVLFVLANLFGRNR